MNETGKIAQDHRRCQRLYMPRNHRRVTQTSEIMLQSWRANCDVQVLVYNSDPMHPDIAEIAKITDYIVAYSCKGNTTWMEEREQTKKLIMAAESLTENVRDVTRIARKVLNRISTRRLISKQEAMCLLAGLPLVDCTETVSGVTINNSMPLREAGEDQEDVRFVTKYSKRKKEDEHMSMYQWFMKYPNGKNRKKTDKIIIPNFVGLSGTPKFPVTEGYARHTLIVHVPWREYPVGWDWLKTFEKFINSKQCPKSCRMTYDRVMQRHYHNLTFYDPKASDGDHSKNVMSMSDRELAILAGLPAHDKLEEDDETRILKALPKGETFAWDKPPKVR